MFLQMILLVYLYKLFACGEKSFFFWGLISSPVKFNQVSVIMTAVHGTDKMTDHIFYLSAILIPIYATQFLFHFSLNQT